MATVGDTFVEASAHTSLVLHIPTGANAGTGWTEEENTIGGATVQRVNFSSDRAESANSSASNRQLYSIQPNPAVASYDVQFTIVTLSAGASPKDDPMFLLARLADASNYYSAGTYGGAAADKKIVKKVAGVVTELASGDNGLTAGDVLKFEVRDAAKKLYQNGGEILTTSDNALTAAGRAGYGAGNAWVSTDDIVNSYQITPFSYVEVADAAQFMAAVAQLSASGGMVGLTYA